MSAPPVWIEVRVDVPAGWAELVAGVLATAGPASGAAFGPASLASEPVPAGQERVRVYFALPSGSATTELEARVGAVLSELPEVTGARELALLAPHFHVVPKEDFATSWKKSWKPFRLGRWCVVDPEWRGALRPGDRRLVLEPGGAFGTGRHATTRMCLQAIEARVAPGARVLDCGTGSGILAVAACLAGAAEAVGFDSDPHAIPYAEELARANGVAGSCRFVVGGCADLGEPRPVYDAVLANLYSDVLIAEAERFAAWLVPGGWFVVSGFSQASREPTLAALERASLRVTDVNRRGRWLAAVGGPGSLEPA